MMNLIYVVTQVDRPNSLIGLGYRSIHLDPEAAKLDLYEANQMTKDPITGWPHWKILVYGVKLKGVLD